MREHCDGMSTYFLGDRIPGTPAGLGCCEPPLPPQLKLIVPSLRGFVCSEALLVLFDEVEAVVHNNRIVSAC